MLDAAVKAHPEFISKAELAEVAGVTLGGGTWNAYFGSLKRNGLIDVDGDQVRASGTLFM